jgi:protein arginine kinase activator
MSPYCTACQKEIASIVVTEVSDLAATGSQHLCVACAEKIGIVQSKGPKFSAELLEDLLGGLKGNRPPARSRTEACPGCGMSLGDFRAKGRLGCPRCYEAFRAELLPLLQRVHESASHRGRLPGRMAAPPAPQDDKGLADLRRRLEDAVRGERYEEAAQLRDQLRRAERGPSESGAKS